MKSYKVLISLSLIFIVFLSLNINSSAKVKAHTVSTMDELTEYLYVNNHQELEIKLAKGFKTEGQPLGLYGYNKVTFDGQNFTLKEKFEVSGEGYGDLYFKNFKFEDDGVEDTDVYFELDIDTKLRKVTLDSFEFKNIKNERFPPLNLVSSYSGMDFNLELTVINSLFENNSSDNGGGIYLFGSTKPILIKDTTFKDNTSTSEEPAAFFAQLIQNSLTFENTVFSDNVSTYEGMRKYNGAAIGLDKTESDQDFTIKNSYFLRNRVEDSKGKSKPGTSIGIYENNKSMKYNIIGSTFAENSSDGGGAAIFIEGENSLFNFENNTFYNNHSNTMKKESYVDVNQGGAILLFNRANRSKELTESFTSKNNTFYSNQMKNYSPSSSLEARGGAISTISISENNFINDLLVGNMTKNNKNPSKIYENISIVGGKINLTDTLGFDNGVQSKETAEMVYGNYPIKLMENKGKVKAGVDSQRITLPTLPIVPKMGENQGIANMNVSNAPEFDQRGYKRVGKQDNGAVEISSVLYDANEGNFTLKELLYFDGKTYYEGANPNQYAKVDVPSYQYTIIDGKKVLKPIRRGYTFLGWSTSKNSTSPNPKYKNGTKHVVADQLKLYAVWSSNSSKTATIRYYNNGKTVGVVPIQKTVKSGSYISIFEKGKMKRKGYKFIGWSTKPNATKPNANYKPGKVFKLTKNIKLYAVWKR